MSGRQRIGGLYSFDRAALSQHPIGANCKKQIALKLNAPQLACTREIEGFCPINCNYCKSLMLRAFLVRVADLERDAA